MSTGRVRLRSRRHEAGLIGEHYRLDAIAQVQFGEHTRDVRLDCRFAQRQLFGQFAVC